MEGINQHFVKPDTQVTSIAACCLRPAEMPINRMCKLRKVFGILCFVLYSGGFSIVSKFAYHFNDEMGDTHLYFTVVQNSSAFILMVK